MVANERSLTRFSCIFLFRNKLGQKSTIRLRSEFSRLHLCWKKNVSNCFSANPMTFRGNFLLRFFSNKACARLFHVSKMTGKREKKCRTADRFVFDRRVSRLETPRRFHSNVRAKTANRKQRDSAKLFAERAGKSISRRNSIKTHQVSGGGRAKFERRPIIL